MPRTVELGKDSLRLKFTGLRHFETLTAEFDVPYVRMKSVDTGLFQFPPGIMWREGLSVPFTDIREGHFEFEGKWYFVSFEDREKVVTIYLDGFDFKGKSYSVLAFQVDDSEAFVEELLRRAPSIERVEA